MPLPVALSGLLRGGLKNLPFVGQIAGGAKNSMPHLEDEVQVTVVGQPGSKRKDLYFLALSAAFSVVRRFDAAQSIAPPPGMLMLEYGIGTGPEDHAVRVTLRFRTSLLSSAVAASVASAPGFLATGIGALIPGVGTVLGSTTDAQLAQYAGAAGSLPMYAEAAIFSGPRDEVVGGEFTLTGYAVPGLPSTSKAKGAPQLPFAGRTIVTKSDACIDPDPANPPGTGLTVPAYNPRPAGDDRSRGGVPTTDPLTGRVVNLLVPLVHAAIANPGSPFMQTFLPPSTGG